MAMAMPRPVLRLGAGFVRFDMARFMTGSIVLVRPVSNAILFSCDARGASPPCIIQAFLRRQSGRGFGSKADKGDGDA
jgi:hypothetical protein